MNPSLDELLDRLVSGETTTLEAKAASELGKSVVESVVAFANEPNLGGGYLLLGVASPPDALFPSYEVTGVPDPERLQADLASQCRSMLTPPIRPVMSVERVNGKHVVVAFIPEAQPHEKPVYITSRGLPSGAYRRIGSSDQVCTEDDLELFYQGRGTVTRDATTVVDASLEDLDPRAIAEYRRLRGEYNPVASELALDDDGLLEAIGAAVRRKGAMVPTLAGLLLFGTPGALRRLYPMNRVDYIRVPSREWVPDPEDRYQATELRGPLLTLVPQVVFQTLEDVPKAHTIASGELHRREVPLIPQNVLREAIVNALMHRNLNKHQPVQIIRYTNRLEIKNAGYSLKPDERLGEPGSVTRNPVLAAVLHEVRLAETKGTGVRTMREAMAKANLSEPLFESDRANDTFAVTLLTHHFFGPEDLAWLEQFRDCGLSDDDARALIVLRELGAITNADFRNTTGVETIVASRRLQHLRDLGLLEQRGKGAGTYYVPGRRMLTDSSHGPDRPIPVGNGIEAALPTESNPVGKALPTGFPASLVGQARALGRRAAPANVRTAILAMCAWRALRASEIAEILERDKNYILTAYLRPMVQEGALKYAHPEQPAHPQQAYRSTPDAAAPA